MAAPTEDEEGIVFKVCLVGNMDVGKTALVTRSTEQAFLAHPTATHGVEWKRKVVSWHRRTVTLQIWDTAGQERFASLCPLFCKKANAVLLCYNTRDLNSFRELDSWIERTRVPSMALLVLVGTKTDLPGPAVVTTEQGEAKAMLLREGGVRFFETSAKSGANVDDVFDYVVDTLMSSYTPDPITDTINLARPPEPGRTSYCCSSS